MFKDMPLTPLSIVSGIADLMRAADSDSLIEYTKNTRVEPVVLVDQAIRSQPYMVDVMQTITSLFSAYYLQAISVSVNVGKIDVVRLLDKLSTDRSPLNSALSSSYTDAITTEDYKYKLPNYKVALEARDAPERTSAGSGKNLAVLGKAFSENSDLSVGKMLEVELSDGGHTASIPVMVRLQAVTTSTASLLNILADKAFGDSLGERYHKWRAGELTFMRDIVLCQDIIDAHRKTLMEDKTGIYESMLKRRKNNRLSAILSGRPSINTASTVVVLSRSTADQLEAKIGGKLSNFRKRETLFKDLFIMILVVVDPEWEQITVYHRSIDHGSELSVKEIKAGNRNTGPDVSEILKAYQLGNAPTF